MTATSAEVVEIDALMHGLDHNLSCYLLPGPQPTLVEPGPESSLDEVVRRLEELGVGPSDLARVVVTHVHLDHGGGAGRAAELFPRAEIVVHTEGARHLADPSRLVASATRVYGEDRMAHLWGDVKPVPAERLRAVDDGDVIDLGGGRRLDVLYTPGHAKHLMCLVDSGTGAVFVGDAVGITLPGTGIVRPTVPPPDIDPDLLVSQLHRLADRGPAAIGFAHFGLVSEVDEVLAQAERRLRRWEEAVASGLAEGLEGDALAERLAGTAHADYLADGHAPEAVAAIEERTSYATEAAGLARAHRHRHPH